jgi:hypothetical protein
MNEYERAGCLELTRRMSRLILFQDIDTSQDNDPMMPSLSEHRWLDAAYVDWLTIIDDLNSNVFSTVDSWSEAVSVSWVPLLEHAPDNSLLHLLAREREAWFKKRVLKIPRTQTDDWLHRFSIAARRLKKLAMLAPRSLLTDPLSESRHL